MTECKELLQLSTTSTVEVNDFGQKKVDILYRRIDDILKTHLINFHRCCIGGSCGKGTALVDNFDLDIMVFINLDGEISVSNYIRQRSDTLKYMKRIISQILSIESHINRRPPYFSIYFSLNGIKVDLVIALNLVCDENEEEQEDIATRQYEAVIDLIHRDEKRPVWMNAFELSSSVCESAVRFVKNQSDFVKQLIIMCKYWSHLYCRDIHFGGKSSTIELIAIHVGNDLENISDLEIAFKEFLIQLTKLKKMTVSFLPQSGFKSSYVDKNPPHLLDPQNPYNNRLKRLKDRDFINLCTIASQYLSEWFSWINTEAEAESVDKPTVIQKEVKDLIEEKNIKERTFRRKHCRQIQKHIPRVSRLNNIFIIFGVVIGAVLFINLSFMLSTKERNLVKPEKNKNDSESVEDMKSQLLNRFKKMLIDVHKINNENDWNIKKTANLSKSVEAPFLNTIDMIYNINSIIGERALACTKNSCPDSINLHFLQKKLEYINTAERNMENVTNLIRQEIMSEQLIQKLNSVRWNLIKLRTINSIELNITVEFNTELKSLKYLKSLSGYDLIDEELTILENISSGCNETFQIFTSIITKTIEMINATVTDVGKHISVISSLSNKYLKTA